MNVCLKTVLIVLSLSFSLHAQEPLIKDIKVTKSVKIGVITPKEKSPKLYSEKERKEHKESMAGKTTVGVKIDF